MDEQPQLRLDPDLPFVSRQSLGVAQFGNGAERIILLNMVLGLVLCARFQTNAVDVFNAHTIATKDVGLSGDTVSGSGKDGSPASATLGERCGRSSVPAKISTVAVSGLGQIIGQ